MEYYSISTWSHGKLLKLNASLNDDGDEYTISIEKNSDGKPSLIYTQRVFTSGLIQTYGKNLVEAFNKRNEISVKSLKYMREKTKGLSF